MLSDIERFQTNKSELVDALILWGPNYPISHLGTHRLLYLLYTIPRIKCIYDGAISTYCEIITDTQVRVPILLGPPSSSGGT
jgi:hypothetical protein